MPKIAQTPPAITTTTRSTTTTPKSCPMARVPFYIRRDGHFYDKDGQIRRDIEADVLLALNNASNDDLAGDIAKLLENVFDLGQQKELNELIIRNNIALELPFNVTSALGLVGITPTLYFEGELAKIAMTGEAHVSIEYAVNWPSRALIRQFLMTRIPVIAVNNIVLDYALSPRLTLEYLGGIFSGPRNDLLGDTQSMIDPFIFASEQGKTHILEFSNFLDQWNGGLMGKFLDKLADLLAKHGDLTLPSGGQFNSEHGRYLIEEVQKLRKIQTSAKNQSPEKIPKTDPSAKPKTGPDCVIQ